MITKIKKSGLFLLFSAVAVCFFISGCEQKENKPVKIGTGGLSGVYYPAGNIIGNFVNRKPEYGIKCEVVSTTGSDMNINSILKNKFELGLSQSDRLYQAFLRSGILEG